MKKKLLVMLMAFVTMSMGVWAQTRTISGTVTSAEDGTTLPGVTVRVKDAPGGVTTNQNGQYQITVSAQAETLVFSFIGMKTTEVAIGGRTTINVALESETTELGEVVVTALGIKRESKALGYAVSKVDSKELTKVGSTNFGSALYGKAAGVRISSAPGGPTSAVDIKIRGMNSINFSSQPLIIVDGVPIRNGEANNAGYWGDQRIRGNGLVDINPEDIADLSVLKGASASALYGSEAANGVVVITTKTGTRRQGIGVDASYTYTVETPAYNPPFQNEYGPGYYDAINIGSYGTDRDGWLYYENPRVYDPDSDSWGTYDGTIRYAPYRAYGQYGPKFDGQPTLSWNGEIVPYDAQPDNYNNLFASGSNSMANVAVNKAGDWGNMRFSYTRLDYKGTTRGNTHDRNTFNLNSTLNLGKRLQVDLVAQYVNQHTLNRPYKISRITNNYGGFLSRFDKAEWYLDKYQTSKGYYFRTGSQPSATPDENIYLSIRATDLLDYFWRTLANQEDEWQDRLMTSATARLTIADGLTFRGRIGNDFTSVRRESRSRTTVPLSIGNSGGFSMGMDNYTTAYGDALLSLDKDLTESIGLLVNLGWQGRRETYKAVNAGTQGGLSAENWFHQNASNNNGTRNGSSSYNELLKYAFLGTASLSFRDFAFVEFTGRQESSSTLPPGSNTFFYPSVNASLIFSEALGLDNSSMDYGKLRVAWGIVGNAPPLYAANNAYDQGSINGIIYNSVSTNYGNDGIRPEEKHEFEVGTELKFFGNRFGLEATVYSNRIVDQILWLDVPTTVGAARMLTNIGELKNLGFEAALYGSPVATNDFRWDLRGNFSTNRNEVVSLMPGVDMLTHANFDSGAALIVSVPGKPMGDIITFMPKMTDDGRYIISDDGFVQLNFEEYDANGDPVDYGYGDTRQKAGNAMPTIVGGFGSYLDYKGFFIDFAIDYSWGGDVVSLAGQYMKGAGMFEETLEWRDAEHGGLAYYYDNDDPLTGTRILGETAPGGQRVYHDGVILDGVKASDGSENDIILQAAEYYVNTFQWGAVPAWGSGMSRYDDAVKKNHYIKFREASIGYNLPQNVAQKLKCNNIRIALVGSNLFYIYRTMKEFDPETNIGTNWVNAASVQGSTSASRSFGFSVRASF